MKKNGMPCIGFLFLSLALFVAGQSQPTILQQAMASGEMIRLHVVAASDDPFDQQTKIIVRDALLAEYGPKLQCAPDNAAMQALLRDHLSEIETAAQAAARDCGYGGTVSASFGAFPFPDRTYAGENVPAGNYTALRVVLGDGEGANWWCVMYPPLCFSGEEALPPNKKVEVEYESTIANWIRSWKENRAANDAS